MPIGFNGPIPGESLTREPGNAPWEQPPKYAGVQEALTFYMDKLEEEDDMLEDTLFLLDQDFPLDLFVESLLLNGEMNGLHTFDTSYLIGPVIHEHILAMANAAGITVREFQGATKGDKAKAKLVGDLQIILGKAPEGNTAVAEIAPTIEEAVTNDVTIPKEPSKGLMTRRT